MKLKEIEFEKVILNELVDKQKGDRTVKPRDIFIDGDLTSSLIGMKAEGLLADVVFYDISHYYSGSDGHKIIEYPFRDFQIDSLSLNLRLIRNILKPNGVLLVTGEECQSEQIDNMLKSVFIDNESGVTINKSVALDHRNKKRVQHSINPLLEARKNSTILDLNSRYTEDIEALRNKVHDSNKNNTYIYLNPDALMLYTRMGDLIQHSRFYEVKKRNKIS